ncbi:MAG: hypothetical protein ACOY5B_08410 [Spirochaetota bacterium]
MVDQYHPTVATLRNLIPEALVFGGSFEKLLPSPKELSPTSRREIFTSIFKQSVDHCVMEACKLTGSKSHHRKTNPSNKRAWPSGFAGSITHKGTAILVAIISQETSKSIGIDLELLHDERMPLDINRICPEGLPFFPSMKNGATIAFSLKEAIFKAQSPLWGLTLDFSDIQLKWKDQFHATCILPDNHKFSAKYGQTGNWITSVAFPD